MITCPRHFEDYDETAGGCPYCEREKLMQYTPDVRGQAPDAGATVSGPAGAILGKLEQVKDGVIQGWVFDEHHPSEKIRFALMVNGEEVGIHRAGAFRDDLADAGIGGGDHAFRIDLPDARLKDGDNIIEVRVLPDGPFIGPLIHSHASPSQTPEPVRGAVLEKVAETRQDTPEPKPEPKPVPGPEPEVRSEPAPPVAMSDFRIREEEPEATIPITELLADIEEFKRLGVPIIIIIGLSQSGKTWFQRTLRDALRMRGIGSPEGWVRAGRIDATKSIGFCRFTGGREDKRTAFVVVDVPGEQIRNLLNREWVATRALIASIQAASSIILTLPSDQVAFSNLVARQVSRPKMLPAWLARQLQAIGITDYTTGRIESLASRYIEIEARIAAALEHDNSTSSLPEEDQVYLAYRRFRDLIESKERLDELGVNLVYLASLLSFLKVNKLGPDDIGTDRVTDRLIRNHAVDLSAFVPVGGHDGKDCPLFVAMTKADLLLSVVARPDSVYYRLSENLRNHIDTRILTHIVPEDERDRLCALAEDPRRILGHCKPEILADIKSWFRLNKVDFVTTHFGYEGGNTLEINQHPDRQFGIEFVISWIHWARSQKRKRGLSYVATELARVIRNNIVDREQDNDMSTAGWS